MARTVTPPPVSGVGITHGAFVGLQMSRFANSPTGRPIARLHFIQDADIRSVRTIGREEDAMQTTEMAPSTRD